MPPILNENLDIIIITMWSLKKLRHRQVHNLIKGTQLVSGEAEMIFSLVLGVSKWPQHFPEDCNSLWLWIRGSVESLVSFVSFSFSNQCIDISKNNSPLPFVGHNVINDPPSARQALTWGGWILTEHIYISFLKSFSYLLPWTYMSGP